MRTVLTLTIFLILGNLIKAQDLGKTFIHNFPPNVYEAHTQNWCLQQSNQGFIYAGNNFGVLEYDGIEWRLIPVSNGSVVRSMVKGKDGTIYVGAQGEFGFLTLDSIGGTRYESLSKLLPDSLQNKFTNIWEIIRLGNNQITFIADDYLFYWDGIKLTYFYSPKGFHRGFSIGARSFIYDYDYGLAEIKDGKSKALPISSFFLDDKRIYALLPYKENYIIAFTRNGIFTFNPDVDTKAKQVFQNTAINATSVYRGILLKSGNYALTTLGDGFFEIDIEGNIINHITQEDGLIDGIAINVMEDAKGGVWVGTNNGISYLELSSPIRYFDKQLGNPGGVNTITNYNGDILAGTDVGLFKLDNGAFKQVSGTENMQIWDLKAFPIPDQNNSILLIGGGDGIFIYDGTNLENITNGVTFQILPDLLDKNRIYLAVESMLRSIYYTPTSKSKFKVEESNLFKAKSEIRGLAQSPDGDIWLGTSISGIDRLRNTGDSFTLVNEYDTFPDLKNLKDLYPYYLNDQLVIATTNGMYHFNASNQTFELQNKVYKLQKAHDVYRMAQKPNGELWFIGVDSKQSPLRALNKQMQEVLGPFRRIPVQSFEELYHESEAVSWMGGASGIYRLDMEKPFTPEHKFPSYIRKVLTTNDSLIHNGSSSSATPSKLNYENNILTFHYTVPSFDGDHPPRFSYKLEGYDKHWSAWTSDTKQHYTNLPENDYRFQVKALNCYGQTSEIGEYRFTIKPPFYRTPLAYFSYLLSLVGLIWGTARLYARKLRKEKEHLERLVEERTAVIREQKDAIQEKNVELEQQTEEILTQRDQLNSQNQLISQKNHQLTSSINYAQRIQQAMLPKQQLLAKVLQEFFVLFMPRDVVSGDFYWATQKNGYSLIAAVDCTGHGVPGAFMSMIGDALLDQVVAEKGVTQPDKILTLLNRGVKTILKQNESDNQDGMDMALCCIDYESKELSFSGAKNSLIYLQEGELHTIKGSRSSIGGNFKISSGGFHTTTIKFDKPTHCYLFSDGYIDQLGGPKGRKLLTKRFRAIIEDIYQLPMQEQEQRLKKRILDWMDEGHERQIDDIMVIGFKLG